MGKDLELEISANANALKNKAEQFCQKLSELDEIENKIQQSINSMSQLNLIETK